MIALRNGCLLFQLDNGELVPCSPDMLCIQQAGTPEKTLDTDWLRHVVASVFHYFKVELQRERVTVREFSRALETVLRQLGLAVHTEETSPTPGETDLILLAQEAGDGCELSFFPRLRAELRGQLRQSTCVIRFHGLRSCVKQLARTRRWNPRCERLQAQIIAYLRQCLKAEPQPKNCALVVE